MPKSKVEQILGDFAFGRKPLKAAAGEEKNPSAPMVQDNTYIRRKVEEHMKKKPMPEQAPKAKKILGGY